MFDFIDRLTGLDIILVLLWLAIIIYGLWSGIVRQAVLAGAIMAGILLASAITPPLSIWTGPVTTLGREGALGPTYTFVMLLIAVVVYTVTVRSYPTTKFLRGRALDIMLGGVVGFGVGLLVVAELTAIIGLLARNQWGAADMVRTAINAQLASGPVMRLVSSTFPLVTETLTRLLPGG